MLNQDYVNNLLTETEQAKVMLFYQDEGMREAVKKFLLIGLYRDGVIEKGKKHNSLRNAALSLVSNDGINGNNFTNEKIGADLRALWFALNNVENAFENMAIFKEEEKGRSKGNPAR